MSKLNLKAFWKRHEIVTVALGIVFLFAWLGVYETGGTKYAHLHLIYVPIILAAFRYEWQGGLIGGLIGTALMGPLMPLDVALGQPQPLDNWLSRGLYLTGFGVVIGLLHQTLMKRQKEIFRISNYDPITGLPLFESFRRECETAIGGDSGKNEHAVINLSFVNASEIQSSFGSALFEDVIRASAKRIIEVLPAGYFLSRGGQDRFFLLVHHADAISASKIGRDLMAAFDQPVDANGVPIQISIAVGLACFPEHGKDVEELIRASHSAMNEASANDRSIHIFDRSLDESLRENLNLLSELGQAVVNGDIVFYAQPKVWLESNQFAGAELLARWHHPKRGFVPPGQFIPIAEQSRLVSAITRSCLTAAKVYIERGTKILGHNDFRIAINVSGDDLLDANFPNDLAATFSNNERLLQQLELEITETAIVKDFDTAIPMLETIREMGVHVAIDDFGTGYSSLKYLSEIPCDTLKIDQSFIRDVQTSRKKECLVRHTIDLAHDLQMRTVAEGVESFEKADWLLAAGCDIAQGYAYGKPMEIDAWANWVESKTPPA